MTPSAQSRSRRPVLIVSDDAAFVAGIVQEWESGHDSPELKIVSSAASPGCRGEDYLFVVVGGVREDICSQILAAFRPQNVPIIVIGLEAAVLGVADRHSAKVLVLSAAPTWKDLVIALGAEVTRRADSQSRARRAERDNGSLQCEAALGRYIIDTRHNLNNALTSVLGNAELLLLDPANLSANERKQIDTIRLMALRVHETLRRFSSLEKELRSASGEAELAGHAITQDRKLAQEVVRPQLAQAAGAD